MFHFSKWYLKNLQLLENKWVFCCQSNLLFIYNYADFQKDWRVYVREWCIFNEVEIKD